MAPALVSLRSRHRHAAGGHSGSRCANTAAGRPRTLCAVWAHAGHQEIGGIGCRASASQAATTLLAGWMAVAPMVAPGACGAKDLTPYQEANNIAYGVTNIG